MTEGLETWVHDIKLILKHAGVEDDVHLNNATDLEFIRQKLQKESRNKWHIEAMTKSKLCTFVKIHNFEEQKILLKANLDRFHRSLIAKFKSGILPLRLETGRYKGIGKELRFCQVCDN